MSSWWRRLISGGERTSGHPTSSNRASSMHLRWGGLDPSVRLVAVEATLEVAAEPTVAELYFWALQASFADGRRRTGGGHLGLQWHPRHPGSRAVNWGGYGADGQELGGTRSALPSALGNPNTRDLRWDAGRPHRLRIEAGERPGWWRGSVDGVVVRELHGGGDHLVDAMVWSEVFARCDDPSVTVRWSDLGAEDATGAWHRPDRVEVTYQALVDGGCTNTTAALDGDGVRQTTTTERLVAAGAVLPLSPSGAR